MEPWLILVHRVQDSLKHVTNKYCSCTRINFQFVLAEMFEKLYEIQSYPHTVKDNRPAIQKFHLFFKHNIFCFNTKINDVH